MPTEKTMAFEEYLKRKEVPIEERTTLDKWQQYMVKELHLTKGALDVSAEVYEARYEYLPSVGIYSTEFQRTYAGETIMQTRYVITGESGLWGAITAHQTAAQRLGAIGEYEKMELEILRWESLVALREAKRRVYED